MNKKIQSLSQEQVEILIKLQKECPLIPHTGAGRLFSMVRRMKAEKESGIPISIRSGFAISVKTGKYANKMSQQEWEEFYGDLSKQLKRDHLELYDRVFSD